MDRCFWFFLWVLVVVWVFFRILSCNLRHSVWTLWGWFWHSCYLCTWIFLPVRCRCTRLVPNGCISRWLESSGRYLAWLRCRQRRCVSCSSFSRIYLCSRWSLWWTCGLRICFCWFLPGSSFIPRTCLLGWGVGFVVGTQWWFCVRRRYRIVNLWIRFHFLFWWVTSWVVRCHYFFRKAVLIFFSSSYRWVYRWWNRILNFWFLLDRRCLVHWNRSCRFLVRTVRWRWACRSFICIWVWGC